MVSNGGQIYQCDDTFLGANPKLYIGFDKLSKCLYVLITCRTMSIIANVLIIK